VFGFDMPVQMVFSFEAFVAGSAFEPLGFFCVNFTHVSVEF